MSRKIILVLLFAFIGLSTVNSCTHNEPSHGPCAKKIPTWRKQRHHWRHKHRHNEKPVEDPVDIAQKYIDFEVLLQDECTKNGNNRVLEVYDYEKYTLKYNISEFTNTNVSIKIINRLINVDLKNEGENGKTLKDVRLLPDILNYENANWVIDRDLLDISIPYKIVFGKDTVKDCGNLNRNIIDVPLLKYDIDVKMSLPDLDDTQNDKFNNTEQDEVLVFKY